MITRTREAWSDEFVPAAVLRTCIAEHALEVERLERLRAYYDGRHAIGQRVRTSGLPNNRLSHGFPRYICTMASGYLIGNPVMYSAEEGEQAALDEVLRTYEGCAVSSVDSELARDASLFGKGIELLFSDEQAIPRTVALDPRIAFVVYDDSVQSKPLFGVHYHVRRREDGTEDGFCVNVYTREHHYRYNTRSLSVIDSSAPDEVFRHFFCGVPLIEYWNDEDERGDFESVLTLIDAYDALQSDRVNDKQQFVDALLLLYGCSLETDALDRTPSQQLREDKALTIPDSEARAEWLCKQMNEADTEVLKNALKADIHKMSMVPDLTDEQFAGNSSGVAMRYKLLGLEQLTKIKERWFREALRERLGLFAAFMAMKGKKKLDAQAVRMTFTRALPVNELESAQVIQALRGLVPDEELLKRVPFMDR